MHQICCVWPIPVVNSSGLPYLIDRHLIGLDFDGFLITFCAKPHQTFECEIQIIDVQCRTSGLCTLLMLIIYYLRIDIIVQDPMLICT